MELRDFTREGERYIQNHQKTHLIDARDQLVFERYLEPVWMPDLSFPTMTLRRVYLTPLQVEFDCVADAIHVTWGNPSAGNFRVGLYRDNGYTPVGGALLGESGSIAKAGINLSQVVMLADTPLNAGIYWVAVVGDESTTLFMSTNNAVITGGYVQSHYYDLGAYGPLTNPCPATITGTLQVFWSLLRVKG